MARSEGAGAGSDVVAGADTHRGATTNAGALFSIGQMAKLFDLNIRTLRYYDQIGLLKPQVVNQDTGYRYYSSAQFERLNTILYLRALGVPLARIGQFFEGRDVAVMRSIFQDQLADVERRRRELERIQEKIESRIEQIDRASTAQMGVPRMAQMAARKRVALAESLAPDSDLEPIIRDLGRKAKLNESIFLGKVGVSIAKEDLLKRTFTHLNSVFVVLEPGDAYEEAQGEPPGGTGLAEAEGAPSADALAAGMYAIVMVRGTHRDAAPAYGQLLDFIEQEGARVAGDSVEVTVIDSGMTRDESQFVTELQIPVRLSSERGDV